MDRHQPFSQALGGYCDLYIIEMSAFFWKFLTKKSQKRTQQHRKQAVPELWRKSSLFLSKSARRPFGRILFLFSHVDTITASLQLCKRIKVWKFGGCLSPAIRENSLLPPVKLPLSISRDKTMQKPKKAVLSFPLSFLHLYALYHFLPSKAFSSVSPFVQLLTLRVPAVFIQALLNAPLRFSARTILAHPLFLFAINATILFVSISPFVHVCTVKLCVSMGPGVLSGASSWPPRLPFLLSFVCLNQLHSLDLITFPP